MEILSDKNIASEILEIFDFYQMYNEIEEIEKIEDVEIYVKNNKNEIIYNFIQKLKEGKNNEN